MSINVLNYNHITREDKELLFDLFPEGIIAFDTETTGLSPLFDSLIEVSAIKITPNGISQYDQLINPNVPITNSQFHGISDAMVQSAPTSLDVLKEFKLFCEDLPLIAHNARFDTGFVIYHSFLNKIEFGTNDVYDSCQLARFSFKMEAKKFGLAYLSKYLEIPLKNHHRALDDSYACLLIFIKSLEKLKDRRHFKKHSFLFNLNDYKSPIENLPKHLKLLESKTKNQEQLLLKYKGGTRNNEFRAIKPISLLPLPTGNVLYALCVESDIHKNYLLKKITDVKEVEKID